MKGISLFSGMGGDTLGMTNAGIDVVGYSEIKEYIQKTHEANFPDSKLIGGDILKLTDSDIKKIKKIDIVFAGFPCQGFSNAGKKLADDPRNTLFREFVRSAKCLNPDIIIGENVKGLLSRKTSEDEDYIDIIKQEFEKIGYDVIYKVCKCYLYGVPQKRERLIIIGIKKNKLSKYNLSFPDEKKDSNLNLQNIINFDMEGAVEVPDVFFEGIPQECILENLDNEETTSDNVHPYLMSKLNPKDGRLSYAGKTYTDLFSFSKRISPIHCEIIDIRKPSKTIICSFDHQPRLYVPLKNKNGCFLRSLLPNELKQIQGFPKDFQVIGSTKEQIIQIGNAVPPPLIERLVKNIIS